MSLGNAEYVSLQAAREKAAEAHRLLAQGVDPLDQRRVSRAAEAADQARQTTFAEASEHYIASHEAGWLNPKHRQQWRNTLATYADPIIGSLPVQAGHHRIGAARARPDLAHHARNRQPRARQDRAGVVLRHRARLA